MASFFTPPTVPNPLSGGADLGEFIVALINALLVYGAVAAVIFIIFGGFRYILSFGNQENVEKARQTVVYAILGLLIIFLAYLAVSYLLTGVLRVKPAYQLR